MQTEKAKMRKTNIQLDSDYIKEIITGTNDDAIKTILDILHLNMRHEDSEKVILGTINQLLSTAKTRLKGLKLLHNIVLHCSSDALTDQAIGWVSHCMIRHKNDDLREIKLHTLVKILESSKNVDNFNKKFVSDHMNDTFKACLDCQSISEDVTALHCLSTCMQQYPAWFGNHRAKVESFLLKFLESPVQTVVQDAAVAFLYLQQTGSAGTESANYSAQFANQFRKLCTTVNKLFDSIMKHFESETIESHKYNASQDEQKDDCYTFPPFPSTFEESKILSVTTLRIINCLIFLKTMILRKFVTVKSIIPNEVITLTSEILRLHVCLCQEGQMLGVESYFAALELTKMQKECLNVLRALILWGGTDLLPFSLALSKRLTNTLTRIQTCKCFSVNLSFKTILYKTLDTWLALSKNSIHDNTAELLTSALLEDIAPEKSNLVLALTESLKNKSKKKAKSLLDLKSNLRDSKPSDYDVLAKTTTCTLALNTLNVLLETSPGITAPLYKQLVSFVVRTLSDIQVHRTKAPYDNVDCQAGLYKILVTLYKQDSSKIVQPLQLAIRILYGGVNHSNHRISRICFEGLDLIEKIAQPVCHSLRTNLSTDNAGIKIKKYVESGDLDNLEIQDSSDADSIVETGSKSTVHILSNIVIKPVQKNNSEGVSIERDAEQASKNSSDSVEIAEDLPVTNKRELEDTKETFEVETATKNRSDSAEIAEYSPKTNKRELEGTTEAFEEFSTEFLAKHNSQVGDSADDKIEEPPSKKKREETNEEDTPDDMFSAFEGVVQD